MQFSPLTVSTGWFSPLTEAEGWFDKGLVEYAAAAGPVSGSLTATLGAVTLASNADLLIQGSFAGTLAAVSLSSNADLLIQGTLSKALDPLAGSGAADLLVSGSLAATLGDVTLASNGTLGSAAISGAVSATLADATLTANATVSQPATGLHGRRIRGRRVVFDDELPVETVYEQVAKVERPVVIPGIPELAAKVEAAKADVARLDQEFAQAKARKAALAKVRKEHAEAVAALESARAAEAAIIARLHEEDEIMFLLAA